VRALQSRRDARGNAAEIAQAADALNGKADRAYMAMNNNRRDYPVTNGLKLKEMLLEDWHAPARQALIEELEERRAPRRPRRNVAVAAPRKLPE